MTDGISVTHKIIHDDDPDDVVISFYFGEMWWNLNDLVGRT